MLLLSILMFLASVFVFCWLLSKEGDSWLMMEVKTAGCFIVALAAAIIFDFFPWIVPIFIAIPLVLFIAFNHIPGLRFFISSKVFAYMKPNTPRISETERSVIDTGDLSWENDLFIGRYGSDMHKEVPLKKLTAVEKKFLANETEELCKLCSPAEIDKHKGLPPVALDYIKQHKFWGMIIPRSAGGLGFSATAQAAIISKLASRSSALSVMVMVPNSLGPGELIMHYGTDAQKKHYLPRLALGEEIPCFALTSQKVGSDAGGLDDYGILTSKTINGKKVLGFNMHFSKRYISLAPIASIIGVAFRAYDPQGLLSKASKTKDGGEDGDLGITCALVPRDAKGVVIGRRHNPLDVFFHNGPIQGKDVFVPLDNIIGGEKMVGKGWQMLMECLAIGRGISLPSLSNAGVQLTSYSSAAYANLREQFGLPIAKFEGVAEQLGQLAINSYAVQALGNNASAMVDKGLKPSVSSAIAKYFTTDTLRNSTKSAMDIHGGKAIMKGPRNYLEELYRSIPIGITVEGANILTRSMIIFGQGFLRCHPFLRSEAEAIAADDTKEFNRLFWLHFARVTQVKTRVLIGAWSGGWALSLSGDEGGREIKGLARHHRRLALLSSQYAYLVEIALALVGGAIKRRESISGRFADAWIAMCVATAAIRKYENDGAPKDALPLLDALLTEMEHRAQKALLDLLNNMPLPAFLRIIIPMIRIAFFPLGNYYRPSSDKQLLGLAKLMSDPDWAQRNLAPNIYWGDVKKEDPLAKLRDAFVMALPVGAIKQRIDKGKHVKKPTETMEEYLARLVKGKAITASERDVWLKSHKATQEIISVDDFAEL